MSPIVQFGKADTPSTLLSKKSKTNHKSPSSRLKKTPSTNNKSGSTEIVNVLENESDAKFAGLPPEEELYGEGNISPKPPTVIEQKVITYFVKHYNMNSEFPMCPNFTEKAYWNYVESLFEDKIYDAAIKSL